jgi:ABC-type dipeptide/oligopeptide/nickel transport system permease subunit
MQNMPQGAAPFLLEDIEAELLENDTARDKIKAMMRKNKPAAISFVVIVIICLAAVFAPLISSYDPNKTSLKDRLAPPSREHILGCDELGRDHFTRLLYGARVSVMIGLFPTAIAMLIGTVLGLAAGFYGGRTDFVIMRLADVVLAFPSLLLAMVVAYTLGGGIISIFLALAAVKWAETARVIRAQTMAMKEKEFVEAAVSMGVRKSVIIFRHILPNCLPNIIVLFTLAIPKSILDESSLSFLGVGARPPSTSWGLMVFRCKTFIFDYPWLAIAPGVAILVFVLAFNFLGDGLRDALDPYLKD